MNSNGNTRVISFIWLGVSSQPTKWDTAWSAKLDMKPATEWKSADWGLRLVLQILGTGDPPNLVVVGKTSRSLFYQRIQQPCPTKPGKSQRYFKKKSGERPCVNLNSASSWHSQNHPEPTKGQSGTIDITVPPGLNLSKKVVSWDCDPKRIKSCVAVAEKNMHTYENNYLFLHVGFWSQILAIL